MPQSDRGARTFVRRAVAACVVGDLLSLIAAVVPSLWVFAGSAGSGESALGVLVWPLGGLASLWAFGCYRRVRVGIRRVVLSMLAVCLLDTGVSMLFYGPGLARLTWAAVQIDVSAGVLASVLIVLGRRMTLGLLAMYRVAATA